MSRFKETHNLKHTADNNLASSLIKICHSQGDHILVGTDRDMRLWGVEDRQKPKLLSTVGLSLDIVSGEC